MKTITKNCLTSALLLSLFVASNVNAAIEETGKEDNKPPIGCRNAGYHFELKTLHLKPGESGDNQSMYVLYNELTQPVNLYQMRDEESSRSMFLNHVLGPHEWGVLSTSEKRVKFICSIPNKKSPYGEVVDCATTLRVCEYTNVRYGLNNRGNYWLINSATKGSAINTIIHYGIIPGN